MSISESKEILANIGEICLARSISVYLHYFRAKIFLFCFILTRIFSLTSENLICITLLAVKLKFTCLNKFAYSFTQTRAASVYSQLATAIHGFGVSTAHACDILRYYKTFTHFCIFAFNLRLYSTESSPSFF